MTIDDLNKVINLTHEQQMELINTLKNRFKENMKRHKDIQWEDVEARLRVIQISFGPYTKWKLPVVNLMWLLMIMIKENIFSLIVQRNSYRQEKCLL